MVANKRSKLQEVEDEPDWGPKLTQHKIFYVGHFSCCCVFHPKAARELYDIWFKTVLTGKEDLSDTYMSSGGKNRMAQRKSAHTDIGEELLLLSKTWEILIGLQALRIQ